MDIYLLHGRGGSPRGTVSKLEESLNAKLPGFLYVRPNLPHGRDFGVQAAERSVEFVRQLGIPQGAFLIGISLGGLVAAALQETERPDLHVVCISSPTQADGVRLQRTMPNRTAIYSSNDDVIAGRTEQWPELSQAHDLPWLSHDTDQFIDRLTPVIASLISSAVVPLGGETR